ncbi:MAG TPA: hypothetical protein VK638_38865 [Edaphobacter sp.]|nr:hypothetical protein [Edaphobacter sp.]
MSKRGNHEGTIIKLKDGKGFKGAVRLGVDADGKPIRKWVQRKSRDEVQAELKRMIRKHEEQPINAIEKARQARTVEVDAALWHSMKFFVEGLAIMGTVKQSNPTLHDQVVKLARMIEGSN